MSGSAFDKPPEIPVETWEGCTAGELAGYWRVPAVHLFARVGSTNDVARRLAQRGAGSGTIVIAEEQVTGRGRGAHTWSSPPGLGLWCSLILRGIPAGAVGLLPIRVAVVLAGSLDTWTRAGARIKWPNDLVLSGRKLGGILCEASWDGHALDHVVVGVGLNLIQGEGDFPPGIRELATSLRLFAGEPVARFDVASAVVPQLSRLALAPWPPVPAVLERFAARDALAGHSIDIRDPASEQVILSGTAAGIDQNGALLVRQSDGSEATVRSGTVRLRDR